MSADDILFEPITKKIRVGTIVIDMSGRRLTVVDITEDVDYVTCAWVPADIAGLKRAFRNTGRSARIG
jgi:hypothetical protein